MVTFNNLVTFVYWVTFEKHVYMEKESQLLALRDSARTELMAIKTVEEGMTRLNKLKSIETWVKAEKMDAELQNIVAEQKLRTQRVLGELLKDTGVKESRCNNLKQNTEVKVVDFGKNLSDIGLTKYQSSNFQKIASIPENEFERFIADKKENVNKAVSELTTAGALKLAGQLNPNMEERPIMDRQIAVYPHPKYYKLITGHALGSCCAKSEVVESLIKTFFDNMGEEQRHNLLRAYDEATEEERKNPAAKKIWRRN